MSRGSSDGLETEGAAEPGLLLRRQQGDEEDIEKLLDICDNILGRSFCALGDGATSPITSSVQYFRDEYLEHLRLGRCPFDREASTLFASGVSTGSSEAKEPASA